MLHHTLLGLSLLGHGAHVEEIRIACTVFVDGIQGRGPLVRRTAKICIQYAHFMIGL